MLGTVTSRVMGNNDGFGKYPYKAVYDDLVIMGEPVVPILGLVSIPLDLALDTIFLPFDLILWPLGHKKTDR